jgi:hypothetical protein
VVVLLDAEVAAVVMDDDVQVGPARVAGPVLFGAALGPVTGHIKTNGALDVHATGPTPPHTPRWNGKAERVIRTLQVEWAYAHARDSSRQRTRASLVTTASVSYLPRINRSGR